MHPEVDRYAHLDSALHRWDPRWKVASLGILLATFAAVPPPAGQPSLGREVPHALACLGTALALVAISRIPLGFAARRLIPALIFLGAFAAVYPLSFGPSGLSFSGERLLAAAVIALRALAIAFLVFPIFGTSRFDATMRALRALRVPGPLVGIAVFSYRYLFVYSDELRRMRTAMRSRGFRGRPPLHALRTAGNCVGMLLVRSVERTEGILDAMIARGYAGTFRTLDDFRTRPADAAKAAAAVLASLAVLAVRYGP